METSCGAVARLDNVWRAAEIDQLLDMRPGQLLYEMSPVTAWFRAHAGKVLAAKHQKLTNHQSELLATVAADWTVKLWDAKTGTLLTTVHLDPLPNVLVAGELAFCEIRSENGGLLYLAALFPGTWGRSGFHMWDVSDFAYSDQTASAVGKTVKEVMSDSYEFRRDLGIMAADLHPGLQTVW